MYLSTPTKIAILDHERKRTYELRKDGLPDAGEFHGLLCFCPFLYLLALSCNEKVYVCISCFIQKLKLAALFLAPALQGI